MKGRHGVLVLLLSTACVDQANAPTESTTSALGAVPPTESAIWKRIGANNLPDGRYAQASAFDERRISHDTLALAFQVGKRQERVTAAQVKWRVLIEPASPQSCKAQ